MTNPTSIVSQLVDALRDAPSPYQNFRSQKFDKWYVDWLLRKDAALSAAEDWQREQKEAVGDLPPCEWNGHRMGQHSFIAVDGGMRCTKCMIDSDTMQAIFQLAKELKT